MKEPPIVMLGQMSLVSVDKPYLLPQMKRRKPTWIG
jgi:hypothetical protein